MEFYFILGHTLYSVATGKKGFLGNFNRLRVILVKPSSELDVQLCNVIFSTIPRDLYFQEGGSK